MEYLRSSFSLAGFMPSVALVLIFYALLRALRHSMWRIALLSLPGTIAHELTHLVVGFVLHAKPHGFSIWPRPSGNTWALGSVSFRNIGLLNGACVFSACHRSRIARASLVAGSIMRACSGVFAVSSIT